MPQPNEHKLELSRLLIRPAIWLTLIAVGVVLAANRLGVLTQSVQQQRKASATGQARIAQLRSLEQDYLAVKDQAALVAARVPSESEVPNFVKQLEDTAAARSVNLELQFDAEANKAVATNKFLKFKVLLTGKRDDVVAVWRALENGRYLVAFEAFDFSVDQTGGTSKLTASAKLFSDDPFK